MEYVIAFAGGLCFLFVWAGLTWPRPAARPQQQEGRPEQFRLRELRGGPLAPLGGAVEDLAAWFRGRGAEDATWRGGMNGRYLTLLKQADWYWAAGEAAPPSPQAPFWNLETLWAAKLFHAGLFGLGGLVLAGAAAASLVVGPGDILLTASAHVRRYIAAKADLVDAVPEYLPAPLLFVGELMLIRVDPQRLDPWRLLAFLRSPATQQRLQAMARGQTAHLMAPDVLALPVPLARLQGAEVGELAHLLQEEAHQARVESRRRREIARSIGRVFGQP